MISDMHEQWMTGDEVAPRWVFIYWAMQKRGMSMHTDWYEQRLNNSNSHAWSGFVRSGWRLKYFGYNGWYQLEKSSLWPTSFPVITSTTSPANVWGNINRSSPSIVLLFQIVSRSPNGHQVNGENMVFILFSHLPGMCRCNYSICQSWARL